MTRPVRSGTDALAQDEPGAGPQAVASRSAEPGVPQPAQQQQRQAAKPANSRCWALNLITVFKARFPASPCMSLYNRKARFYEVGHAGLPATARRVPDLLLPSGGLQALGQRSARLSEVASPRGEGWRC